MGAATTIGDPTAVPAPTAKEEIYSFRFTGNRRLRDKVARAKAVMASKLKTTNIDDVLEVALDCLLDKHDPKRREERAAKREAVRPLLNEPAKQKPEGRQRTRYIKAPDSRMTLKRAEYRCQWISDGRRCSATSMLQLDHVVSFAKGGSADHSNLQVLCRAHNLLKARMEYGDQKMNQTRPPHQSQRK